MKTIVEKNRMIAEFIGFKLQDNPNERWFGQYFTTSNGLWANRIELLHFDTSWDWLMPVVEKIESVNEGVPQQLLNVSLFSYIEDVYNAVVEFIEWYNENEKQ